MNKTIAHITDTHIDDPTALSRGIDPRQNVLLLLEDLVQRRPDEVVFTGDIGSAGSYGWLFDRLSEYNPNFRLTLGNHDDPVEAMQFYTGKSAGSEGLYYCYEDDFYKYLYLDSSSGSIGPLQLQWLESELNTTKQLIVFIHHPVLCLNTGMDATYPLENRDEVAAVLQAARQQVTLFCGHYHMPDKRSAGQLTQYVTPAVSFQIRKASMGIDIYTQQFGYRLITLTEQRVTTQLVLSFYDRFTAGRG